MTAPGEEGPRRVLAANLVSERESDNRPSAPLATTAAATSASAEAARVEARALAPVLALVALALCAGEWYLSSRRD